MIPPSRASKEEWRQWAKDVRARVDWGACGERIRRSLDRYLAGLGPARIVTYLAMSSEVDLDPLVGEHPEHRFYVTRTPVEGGLTVHAYDSPRERHPFGFEQPVEAAPRVAIEDIDGVLVPGLAFDRRGVRLGRGKGYFDEFLSRLGPVLRIGVVPLDLVVVELPSDPLDVRMSHLATEEGVRPVGLPPPPSR